MTIRSCSYEVVSIHTKEQAVGAQLVKCPVLDFSSGHDGFELRVRLCADGTELAWDFPSLLLPNMHVLSLSK